MGQEKYNMELIIDFYTKSDDDMDEKACKEMAKEWFELVDFDESNEINASKFVTLVTESLAMEEDQEKIKKCF